MKKIQDCEIKNCIPTPFSCIDWTCGDIEFLGICNGDPACNVIWEIIYKLQALSADNIASFDIDSLLNICQQQPPLEVNLLSVLNVIKNNEICLNDKITTLSDIVAGLTSDTTLSVNLKCYATQDNLGNILSIDRKSFDQLIIDNLCNHKLRIEGLEGTVISLQNQINAIDIHPVVEELSFATCINGSILPTSTQVINTSQALCDLVEATGTVTDIATALALTPGDLNAEFGLITGWDLTPENWAQNYGNTLLEIENLRQRIKFMEDNCCAASCKDVELGFCAIYNEDNTGIIVKFTAGCGTNIPSGFLDIGSTITITDIDGNVETFTTSNPDLIANNAQIEISISGLNLNGDLEVDIDANMSNEILTCSKCLHKTVKKVQCDFCEICASGAEGSSVVIIYESSSTSLTVENSSTTTSTSTTTTTTAP